MTNITEIAEQIVKVKGKPGRKKAVKPEVESKSASLPERQEQSVPVQQFQNLQPIIRDIPKSRMELERERDNRMVTGRFKNYETPGGTLKFDYLKHPGEQLRRFELKDGEVYSIPFGVAEHLRKNCTYPVHEYLLDEKGNPSQRVGQMVNRFWFEPLDFSMPDHGPEKRILEVQNLGLRQPKGY